MHSVQTAIKPTSTIEEVFHQEADTFDLTVTLTDYHLAFVLKDYVDWVIYEREYTQNDIGGDIHKKMNLRDVYERLGSTRKQDEKKERKQGVRTKMCYEFGQVVKSKDVSCYKIERGGKITVYHPLIELSKNTEANYESVLILQKAKKFTEIEILLLKSDRERKQLFEELKRIDEERKLLERKVERGEKQREELKRRISKLQKRGKNKFTKLTKKQIACLVSFLLIAIIVKFMGIFTTNDELASKIYELNSPNTEKINKTSHEIQAEAFEQVSKLDQKQIQDTESKAKESKNELKEDLNKKEEKLNEKLDEIERASKKEMNNIEEQKITKHQAS